MVCSCGNPQAKMRRNQPDARSCRYLHHAAYRIDELIRAVSMFVYLKAARIFIGERGNGNAAAGVVFGNESVSQYRYIMA